MSEVAEEPKIIENLSKNCEKENEETEHDPHYDPIVSLPEVEVPTLEEDEIVMLHLRAKLYRYDSKETPAEWKERGTGNVKILRHKLHNTVRVVMRRDKTLKLCANHFILPSMNLKPSASCERAWVYSVKDFSDETVKSELLAIKFANLDHAQTWKDVFEEAKKIVAKANSKENCKAEASGENKVSEDKKENEEPTSPPEQKNSEVTEKMSTMSIKETKES